MKKIMKKALSLVLVFAMLCLPNFAAFAAGPPVGTNMNMDTLTPGVAKEVTVDPMGAYYFVLDTSAAYTLTVSSSSNAYCVYFYEDAMNPMGMPINAYNNNSCDMGGNYSISTSLLPVTPACFYIANGAEESVTYTVKIEGSTGTIAGDGSMNNPYDITNAKDNVPILGYGESAYYMVTGLTGGKQYKVTVSAGMMGGSYQLLDANGENPVDSAQMGPGGVGASMTTTAFYASGAVVFMIANTNLGESGPFKVTVEEEDPLGSEYNKDDLVFSDNYQDITLTEDQNRYYYTWEADKEGYVTIDLPAGLNASTGWICSVSEDNFKFDTKYIASNYEGDDDDETEFANPIKVGVKEGETLNMFIAALDYEAGTVYFKVTFEEGTVERVEEEEEELFSTITKYDETLEMELPVYQVYNEAVVESGDVPLGSLVGYPTLYAFTPASAGTYELKVSDGKIGFYGYNTSSLTAPSNATDTVEVTITNAGQSAYVGVTDTTEEATGVALTVTLKEVINEKPADKEYTEVWFEGPSPDAYTFDGDVDNLVFIDVEDKVVDKVVYSVTDGYYHYGTATGPIVLVDLDGKYGSIDPNGTAQNNGLIGLDENGDGWDYSELYKFYAAIADKETKLYPLNDDLLEIYKVAGKGQGWYVEALGGIATEDAYLFNCCYVEELEKETGTETEKQPEKEPVKVEVPSTGVVEESELDAAIQEAIKNDAPLVVETTTEGVTLTFAPADLKDAEAVKLNVEVKLDADVKDETVAKNDDITADNFVLKVEFSHDGKLPAKATITIPVPAKFANKTLFYYEILADGTLKFVCDAPVDANGNAKVTQDHCSDYVLLTEKVAEAPKTGDATNFALWIAVLGLGVVAMAGSVVMKKREF